MIDRHDAGAALASIEAARHRSLQLGGYAHAGDFVLAWGLVWLVCNLTAHLAPDWSQTAWCAGIMLATGFCIWRGISRPRSSAGTDPRIYGCIAAAMAFIALTVAVGEMHDERQVNAILSLFVAASYVALGMWMGRRFILAGLFIAAMVLAGWFADRGNFHLWMALGGGGALIATGLWLRRA